MNEAFEKWEEKYYINGGTQDRIGKAAYKAGRKARQEQDSGIADTIKLRPSQTASVAIEIAAAIRAQE